MPICAISNLGLIVSLLLFFDLEQATLHTPALAIFFLLFHLCHGIGLDERSCL